jgi:hypothetical protein
MLAGVYLLGSDKVIDIDDAEKWVRAQDWSLNTNITAEKEWERLLRHLSNSIVKAGTRREGQADYTVGELIDAILKGDEYITRDFADRSLRMHGIAVKDTGVCIATGNQNLSRLLRGTQWEVDWGRTLCTIEGAKMLTACYFSSQVRQRAVTIPRQYFTGSDDIDFAMGDE